MVIAQTDPTELPVHLTAPLRPSSSRSGYSVYQKWTHSDHRMSDPRRINRRNILISERDDLLAGGHTSCSASPSCGEIGASHDDGRSCGATVLRPPRDRAPQAPPRGSGEAHRQPARAA